MEDIEELYKIGANKVIPEEFETSIELFDRILSKLLIPRREINSIIGRIRDDNYGIFRETESKTDGSALKDHADLEITAFKVDKNAPVTGQSIIELQLRNNYSVTIVALMRNKELIDNPDPEIIFQSDDIVYVMGRSENIARSSELFAEKIVIKEDFIEN